MNLTDQVCSLEYAKRLKELGVKYRSCFEWLKAPDIDYDAWHAVPLMPNQVQHLGCPAYSVAELFEILPLRLVKDNIHTKLVIDKSQRATSEYVIGYCNNEYQITPIFANVNLANVLAGLLIHLLENGMMELPK